MGLTAIEYGLVDWPPIELPGTSKVTNYPLPYGSQGEEVKVHSEIVEKEVEVSHLGGIVHAI